MGGLSSADLAGATANQAQRSVEDQAVLIDWLIRRVDALESLLVVEGLTVDSIARPELPSQIAQRRMRAMYARERAEMSRNPA